MPEYVLREAITLHTLLRLRQAGEHRPVEIDARDYVRLVVYLSRLPRQDHFSGCDLGCLSVKVGTRSYHLPWPLQRSRHERRCAAQTLSPALNDARDNHELAVHDNRELAVRELAVRENRELAVRARRVLETRSVETGYGIEAREVIESDLIIIGAGLAGTLDHATLPQHRAKHLPLSSTLPERFQVLNLGGAPEPWSQWGQQRAGQHASEWACPGFVLQPSDFIDSQRERYSSAAALGDAIALTALVRGMAVLRDWVSAPLTFEKDTYRFRGEKRLSGKVFSYASPHIDIAVGLGPARWLADEMSGPSREVELELRRRQLVLTGSEYLEEDRDDKDQAVLVIGGGPTAAWCAERAAARAVRRIDWVAASDPPSATTARTSHEKNCGKKLIALKLRVKLTTTPLDERPRLEAQIRDLEGFWRAMLPRNQAIFSAKAVSRAIAGVVDIQRGASEGVQLRFHDQRLATYDRVVVCLGHNPQADTGPAGLTVGMLLRPVLVKVGERERLVALENTGSPAARVRVLGAAMYAQGMAKRVSTLQQIEVERLCTEQSERAATSRDSAWVFGSVRQAVTDIPLANGLTTTPR